MNPGVGWRPGLSPRKVEPRTEPSAPKPTIRLELKPGASPPQSPARDPDPPSGDPWYYGVLGRNTVQVPVNAIYYASAVMVLLAFVAVIAGSLMARNRAASNEPVRPAPPVTEPAEYTPDPAPAASNAQAQKPTEGTRQTSKIEPPKPSPASTIAPGNTITSKGGLAGDPREPEMNYLALAIMTRTEAEAAVAFLSQNGLEAFAIPVDRAGGNANNLDPSKSPYRLYAAKGVSKAEYEKKMTARTNTEAAVARLGQVWQKEHRGSSNFAKPNWERYK